jgi:phenylacetyl-CoA:acceptor oxidoreductase 26-kDa subunit
MSQPSRTRAAPDPFGPNPWQQTSWDIRAAGNFVCGGMGCGLIIFTALSDAQGRALTALMLAGLVLVGMGLFSVFLEIGRPLRFARVVFNPRLSWMSREALASMVLFPAALGAALGIGPLVWLAAVAALVFLYCQVSILQAAKGIPAWREPLTVPLLLATGLAEGGGIFWLAPVWHGPFALRLWLLFGALLALRLGLWWAWRRRLAGSAAPGALAAIDAAGKVYVGGTVLALLLVPGALFLPAGAAMAMLAGAVAAATGAWFKYTLVTRAGHNQGFALARLPVRGVPR